MNTASAELSIALIVIVALVAFAFLSRLAMNIVWKVRITERLAGEHNAALGIEYAGYYLGVLLIVCSVLGGISVSEPTIARLLENGSMTMTGYAFQVAVYGTIGIIALALFGRLGFRLLIRTDIVAGVRANNAAAGIVAAAGHISVALVIAGAFSGESEGGDASVSALFLLAGLAALWGITYLIRFITSYDDAREITNGNAAAALSYAGMMVAVGMVVGHAIEGNFTDYANSFSLFGKALLVVLIFYPIRQFITQAILLGGGFHLYGGRLDEEISRDHNIGTGAVEAATYIASALLALRLGY